MAFGAAKSQVGIVYGEAGGEKLTMDYFPPAGPAPHPVAIIIHGGGFIGGTSKNNSEAYCADFLAPAGYAVFSINYRLAPKYPYPAMVEDVERAIRYSGTTQKMERRSGPDRAGGRIGRRLLKQYGGVLNAAGIKGAKDPVDRSARAFKPWSLCSVPAIFVGKRLRRV